MPSLPIRVAACTSSFSGRGGRWFVAVVCTARPKIASGKPFAAASRETGILIGNLLLTVAAAMVLLGTLFPLIADAFGLGKVSVGPPYFGLLFPLLMLPVLLLLPFGPYLHWGKAEAAPLQTLGTRAGIAAIACALVGSVFADGQAKAIAGMGVAAWVAAGTALYVVKRWREMPHGRRFPAEMAGMLIAHAGVAVFVAGVLVSESLSVERDVRLSPGASAQIAGYNFRFDGVQLMDGPNWKAEQGSVQVSRDGQVVAQLHPQNVCTAASGSRPNRRSIPASPATCMSRSASPWTTSTSKTTGRCGCTTNPSFAGSGPAAC